MSLLLLFESHHPTTAEGRSTAPPPFVHAFVRADCDTWRTTRTQGTPIDMPFLEGFPPNDELPSGTWVTKLVSSLLGAVVGTTRSRHLRTGMQYY